MFSSKIMYKFTIQFIFSYNLALIQTTKKYLSHKLEILDEKVEDQAEASKVILNGVSNIILFLLL